MLNLSTLLAQADPFDLTRGQSEPGRILGMALKDIILVGGIIVALSLILFFVTWYFRRDPRNRGESRKRVLYHSEERSHGKVRIRRKRRQHPDNLPRKPSLAEAGGLPPIREQPSEPAC